MSMKNIFLAGLLILSIVLFFWIAYEPPNPTPEETMLSVELQVSKEVEAGKPFTVNAFLHNNSKFDWRITHGSDMFKYRVVDEHGELVPDNKTSFRNDIRLEHLFKSKSRYLNEGEGGVVNNRYMLEINEPGKFFVTAYASFILQEERKNKPTWHHRFELESDPVTVIVK